MGVYVSKKRLEWGESVYELLQDIRWGNGNLIVWLTNDRIVGMIKRSYC